MAVTPNDIPTREALIDVLAPRSGIAGIPSLMAHVLHHAPAAR